MFPLVEIKHLKKEYQIAKHERHLVLKNINLKLFSKETFGLIGDSGSGKTTLIRCLMFLEEMTEGEILLKGKSHFNFRKKDFFDFKRSVQMVFQNGFGSLNPSLSVEENIAEPLLIHQLMKKSNISSEVKKLLNAVGLSAKSCFKYPFEFSGGQQQRIAIARALSIRPALLICDEITASLDVSIQAQILNLLKELQLEYDLSFLFISHDLAVVKYMSDRIGVLKKGEIEEFADFNLLGAKKSMIIEGTCN